jgi:hypothetical protein
MRRLLSLGGLAIAVALVAAGCTLSLNVTKETTGPGEPEGPFTVTINCGGSGSEDLEFNAPFPDGPESASFDFFAPSGTCLITETDPGNASSTTFECENPPPAGISCTQEPDGLQVSAVFDGPLDAIEVDIIVTNDIPTTTTTTTTTAPTTTTTTTTTVDPNALAIVTTPNFTG